MADVEAGLTDARRQRPISPHLGIYRLMLTLVMSGLHRITGFVLYFGMLLPSASIPPSPTPSSRRARSRR